MKKLILILLSFTIAEFGSAQILNPGFESLRSDGNPKFWGSITPLPYTDSSQYCKLDSAFYFTSKDAHSGNFALELRNADCSGIQLGSAHVMTSDSSYFASGIPFKETPKYFSFWYKFNSVSNDTAAAHIWCTNDITGNTIIDQWIYLPIQNVYTKIFVVLNYLKIEAPTTLELNFVTETDKNVAHFGSRLVIDDLEMSDNAMGTQTYQNSPLVTCYPNPTSGIVHFAVNSGIMNTLTIFEPNGTICSITQFELNCDIDCKDLGNGLYLYSVMNSKGVITNGEFIVLK
ncbi:MAG: T9SS type A sorting domain-containing protein [Bacteroidetes bacterium]|nr:T9SS type A sorting domain-containing protein [Bacteroidota bacterium]